VYAHPRNQYVAGFMGYRNLLPATVTSVAGERVTVSVGGVPLTGVNRDGLTAGPAGAVVGAVVAIRPEDFTVAIAASDNVLRADVEIVEYHGREQAVEARLPDGQPLHLRTTSRLAPGDAVRLRVPVERVLVFGS
jgi:putative spermidine/putrescine transport system ATP-binding protein